MSVTETRTIILETAKRLIVDRGLQDTSMSLISKTSGVSVGSIYNLFEGKDDLVNAIYIDCRSRLTDASLYGKREPQETIQQYFKRACGVYMDAAIANPYDFKFLFQFHLTPAIDSRIFGPGDIVLGAPEHTTRYYIQQGTFKSAPPLALDYICLGIISQVVKAHHAGFLEITEELREVVLNACWDAISNNKFPE